MRKTAGGFPMNHSIYSADRTTHLKIVVVALVAGIAVAGFGISARNNSEDYTQTAIDPTIPIARSRLGFFASSAAVAIASNPRDERSRLRKAYRNSRAAS